MKFCPWRASGIGCCFTSFVDYQPITNHPYNENRESVSIFSDWHYREFYRVFERKPAPDLIRGGYRFA
jgi:hypothetical protein